MAWRPERATRCGTRSVRVLETLMNLVDELNTRTRLGRRKAPLGVIFFALTACGGALETELPAAPSSPPPPALRYEIRGADDEHLRDVEVCFQGFTTRRFVLLEGDGIVSATREGQPLVVEKGKGFALDADVTPTCVRYRVRLTPSVRPGFVHDATLLARPLDAPASTAVRIHVRESAGPVVTPFEVDEGAYVPRPSFLERSTTWVYGEGARLLLRDVDGVELRLVILPGQKRIPDEVLEAHLVRSLELARSLAPARYPERVLVAVAPSPVSAGNPPIAFGLARRGGGASVLFVLDEDADEEALAREDWVSVHELAHFAFPAMPRSEAWLTEGWATYFQEVLRARGGLISPEDAWLRLHRGFAKSQHDGTGRPLHEEALAMYETYAFKRVYWAGAATALEDDVALRLRGSRLEEALARVFEGEPFDRWIEFSDYVARLEASGHADLAERAREVRSGTGVPDLSAVYATLGLEARGGSLELDDSAELVSVRRAIVRGDASAPSALRPR